MQRPRVFASRPLPGSALQRLGAEVELQVWEGSRPPTPAELAQACADCEGLLCLLTDRIDQSLLDAAPSLRVISSCSVGVDHVDLSALADRRIPLGHTPHVLTDATADLTLALMLAACRRLPEAEAFVRSGQWTPERRWEPDMLLGRELRDATLGLIGLGPIGQAVARRAQGFGMRILGWTPSGRKVAGVENRSLEELLAEADILSLHLALTPETRHVIHADTFQRMRPEALLINTARGPLVDEAALLQALNSGQIAGAALDVFEAEPIGADHPLLQHPRVLVAPHIGSATASTRARMADMAVDNLLAGLRAEPMPHCANPGAWA